MKNLISFSIACIIIFTVYFFSSNILLSQTDKREQKIGNPAEVKSYISTMKGRVLSKETGKIVPNADVTVREANQQRVINSTQADAQGNYELKIPKGMDIEVKAQAPEFFYDAFKVRVPIDSKSDEAIKRDFHLPSELQLRLNFPTNKYDDPYPYVLDENGMQSELTWQSAVNSVAEDLNKYADYIEKVIIIGHTDSDGSNAANMTLGENRAKFLMNELQKRGVSELLLEARSAGEEELLEKREGEDVNMWKKRCRRVVMQKIMKKR